MMNSRAVFIIVRLHVRQVAVTLCNLFSNLQRNILNNVFVAFAEVRCYIVQCDLSNLQQFVPEKAWRNSLRSRLLARQGRRSVGFTKKQTNKKYRHAWEKLRCKLLEGSYTVQRRLQVATIVAKSITGFYFVQRCAQQQLQCA